MSKSFYIGKALLLLAVALFLHTTSAETNDDWLLGIWKLHYDPEGAKTDYMEFKVDGDIISTGPLGQLEGLYKVNPDSVKVVLSYKGKDVIMTFHFNEQRDELRIVTSHTGRESIYKKLTN